MFASSCPGRDRFYSKRGQEKRELSKSLWEERKKKVNSVSEGGKFLFIRSELMGKKGKERSKNEAPQGESSSLLEKEGKKIR